MDTAAPKHPDAGEPAAAPGAPQDLDLVLLAGALLFANGQTTERTVEATTRLAGALGVRATLFPRWDELAVRLDSGAGSQYGVAAVAPLGVDMGKVTATLGVIDALCAGRIEAEAVRPAFEAIQRHPPISAVRFIVLAAAGAAALGVIFGATHWLSLVLIALCAGAGAGLRRWLAGMSHNPFIQPFCAALLAGVAGAVVVRLQLSSTQSLVAVCPCMVLVPGPHLLNGTLDLARARIAMGAARIGYASLIIVMICTGLLFGLSLGGVALPVSAPSSPVLLGYDVAAAGVAVAAYGTFFAMPWRMLPIPILVGMLAHASRWVTIAIAGGTVETGAFVACLLVGVILTPVADRLRLPFAAVAFASVVSLIPGVFLFRMAGGLVALIAAGANGPPGLLLGIVTDATTAGLILLSMAFGLVLPKMLIEHFDPAIIGPPGGHYR
jgi:uncharacterized membrane protein YjjP (DUF1212 family)